MPLRSSCPRGPAEGTRLAGCSWHVAEPGPEPRSPELPPPPHSFCRGGGPRSSWQQRGAPRGGGLEGWPPADASEASSGPCRSWQSWPALSWGVRTHGRCSVPQTLVSGFEPDRQVSESWWVSASPARKVLHLGTWDMLEREQELCLSVLMSVCPGRVTDRPQPARAPPGRGE